MTTPHWKSMVDIWFTYHVEKKGFEPTFTKAQAKSLKDIIKRLQQLSDKEWTEDYAKSVLIRFLSVAYTDTFLRNNFILNVLYGKFDKIIDIGRNSKTVRSAFDNFYQELSPKNASH